MSSTFPTPGSNGNNEEESEEEDGDGNEESEHMGSSEVPSGDEQDDESPRMVEDAAIGALGVQPLGPGEIVLIVVDDEVDLIEEDEEDEEEVLDPYAEKASSEFTENRGSGLDWGGALGKLRERMNDVESGVNQSPSNALFRVMTSQTPNQVIGEFINTANPQVVAAMSGAVSSLLGGLSNPAMGVETVVKASGEKIGSLCFQLQMTG